MDHARRAWGQYDRISEGARFAVVEGAKGHQAGGGVVAPAVADIPGRSPGGLILDRIATGPRGRASHQAHLGFDPDLPFDERLPQRRCRVQPGEVVGGQAMMLVNWPPRTIVCRPRPSAAFTVPAGFGCARNWPSRDPSGLRRGTAVPLTRMSPVASTARIGDAPRPARRGVGPTRLRR